jgi:hypothetical protein
MIAQLSQPALLLLACAALLVGCDASPTAPRNDRISGQTVSLSGDPCDPQVPPPTLVRALAANRILLRSGGPTSLSGGDCPRGGGQVLGTVTVTAPAPWFNPMPYIMDGGSHSGPVIMNHDLFPPTGASAGGFTVTPTGELLTDAFPDPDASELDPAYLNLPPGLKGLVKKAAADACEREDLVPGQNYTCRIAATNVLARALASMDARMVGMFGNGGPAGVPVDTYTSQLAIEGAMMIRSLDSDPGFPARTLGELHSTVTMMLNAYLLGALQDPRATPSLVAVAGSFMLHTLYMNQSDIIPTAHAWYTQGNFPSFIPRWDPSTNPPPGNQF